MSVSVLPFLEPDTLTEQGIISSAAIVGQSPYPMLNPFCYLKSVTRSRSRSSAG
jgi:hypothetical protein